MIDEEQPKRTGGGRKPSFILTNEMLEEITKLSYRGLNQKMIAAYFGHSQTVWEVKKKKHPEIRLAYLKGKGKGVAFGAGKLMELIKIGNLDAIKYYLSRVGEFSETPEKEPDDEPTKVYKPVMITTTDPIEAAKIYQQIMQNPK